MNSRRAGLRRAGRRFQPAKLVSACLAMGVFAAAAPVGLAEISLEWRAQSSTIREGDTVVIGLYAVSDDEGTHAFAAIDAIISWNPAVLRLLGVRDDGPYAWMGSFFPNDSGLSRLNADCGPARFCSPYTGRPYNDGSALYEAIAPFGLDPAPQATPQGLLVTSFLFLAERGAVSTELVFLEQVGLSATIIADARTYADVTGELRAATLMIHGCGWMGDFDGDCMVGMSDYGLFPACLIGPSGGVIPSVCRIADIDADNDVDLRDFALEQLMFEAVE